MAIQIRYVVSRLHIDGIVTGTIVLNKTHDEKSGVKYGRAISKFVYGKEAWKYVGQIVCDNDTLDNLTSNHGTIDTMILKRTGIDLRSYV